MTNPRGIPVAPFVDKVEDYLASHADVEPTLRSFQEMIACVPRGALVPGARCRTGDADTARGTRLGSTSSWSRIYSAGS